MAVESSAWYSSEDSFKTAPIRIPGRGQDDTFCMTDRDGCNMRGGGQRRLKPMSPFKPMPLPSAA
jgi:hypothetical protein